MTKTYRRKWYYHGAIIRQRGAAFQVEINSGKKRGRETFQSLAEAKTHAEQEQIRLTNEGANVLSLTGKQRLEAVDAIKKLGGIPLSDAVTFYLRHHKPVGGIRTINQLLAEYLDGKKKANKRPDTLTDIKCRIGKLAGTLGERPIHTLTTAELTHWMDENNYQGVSRANYIRAFSGFFRFAHKQGLIEINPVEAIERPEIDESLPEIFTITEVERVLHATEIVYPRLIPAFAIGFFAGLRSAEIEKLDWSAIDFEARLITVIPEIAKKRRQRHVEISENLIAWLLPYRKNAGRLCPPDAVVRRWKKRILKKAGVKRWPSNVMRHCFGSYHLAKFKDISKTALDLGHTRPDVLFNHYRNLVKPADADTYWNIRPASEGKIIQLRATA